MSFHPDKKIVIVIATLATGGAERVASLLANGWVARGNRVTMILLGTTETKHYRLDERVGVVELNCMGNSRSMLDSVTSTWRRARTLRAQVLQQAPDAVVSFMDTTNVLTLLATRGLAVPVVVSERTDPTEYRIAKFWSLLRRCFYPRAQRVVVQTESVARRWAAPFVPAERLRVIANPVAPPHPAEDPALPADLPEQFVVSVGRLVPLKGFDRLLRAYAPLAARPGVPPLVIVGDGPEKDRLLQLAAELGIAEKVYLPGRAASPYPYLRRAVLFAMTSEFEGYPNALIEAMAVGLPVISFDCPSGPGEIIRHGENGLLVPPGDVAALTQAMDRVLTDGALRDQMGARAAKVVESLSVDRILDQWEEAISAGAGRGAP